MAFPEYRRHPLPKHARAPLGWLALCLMGLTSSPFVGFAIHGKVAAPRLIVGLWFAVLPISGLAAIAILRWYAWRRLPWHITEEWTSGKIVPAEGGPAIVPPRRFSNEKYWIETISQGLALSRSCLLSMQGVSATSAKSWIADNTGEMFIPWDDIAEWSVDTDSDGPDYYLLRLRSGGMTRVRRFPPDHATECDLLDAVRSVGQLPIRLRCDVDCEQCRSHHATGPCA